MPGAITFGVYKILPSLELKVLSFVRLNCTLTHNNIFFAYMKYMFLFYQA